MPMATITISLVIGICLSAYITIPTPIIVLLLGIATTITLYTRSMVAIPILLLGAAIYNLHQTDTLPYGIRQRMVVKICEQKSNYGSYTSFTAKVIEYGNDPCRAKVILTADSLFTPRTGDIIEFYGTCRPISRSNSQYSRAMLRRGFAGRVTLTKQSTTLYIAAKTNSFHHSITERLSQIIPHSEGSATATAMALGVRENFNATINTNYSLSGVSHILAVSGLHVAIVYMLLSLLFTPLLLLPRGNKIKAVVMLVVIWLYIALCGWRISAIRAATMFSILQLSYLTRSMHSTENSVAATAFIMVAIDPYLIFDISFTLSLSAVVAIIFVGRGALSSLHTKSYILNKLIDTFTISTLCSIATLPIISNSFGTISLLGILLIPIILITAELAIIFTLSALILPHSAASIAAEAAQWCGALQNSIVQTSLKPHIGYFQYTMSDQAVTAVYAIFATLIVLTLGFKEKKRAKLLKI